MIPTRDNLQFITIVGVALAIFLSLLLSLVEKRRGRKIKWGGFVVFAVAGYGIVMVGFTSKLIADMHAKGNEATTLGIVTARDLPNHDQYQFAYSVGDQRYTSWHQGTVNCGPNRIYVGGVFTVYYDPLHPSRADLCSFKGAVKNDLQILGLMSAMLVLTAIFTRKSW
jgi:hypothetical protein